MLKYFDLNERGKVYFREPRGEESFKGHEPIRGGPSQPVLAAPSPSAKPAPPSASSPLIIESPEEDIRLDHPPEAPPPMAMAAERPPIKPRGLSPFQQFMMYFGVFLGVLFSSAIDKFGKGENFSLSISLIIIAVSLIISFAIIPVVYERLQLKPDSPFIVQFGFFVQQGVFWHVIFNSLSKAASTISSVSSS